MRTFVWSLLDAERYDATGYGVGHALGLAHSDISTALMRADIYYGPGTDVYIAPTADDVRGVGYLY